MRRFAVVVTWRKFLIAGAVIVLAVIGLGWYGAGRNSAYVTGTVDSPRGVYAAPPPAKTDDFEARQLEFDGGQGNLSLGGSHGIVWANEEQVIMKGHLAVHDTASLYSLSGDVDSLRVNGTEQLPRRWKTPGINTITGVIAVIAALITAAGTIIVPVITKRKEL